MRQIVSPSEGVFGAADSWIVPREGVHPLMWSPPGGALISGQKISRCTGLICSDVCWKGFCEEKLASVDYFLDVHLQHIAFHMFARDRLPSLLAKEAFAIPGQLANDLKALWSGLDDTSRAAYRILADTELTKSKLTKSDPLVPL